MDELEAPLMIEYQRISTEAAREGLIITPSSRLKAAAMVLVARPVEPLNQIVDTGAAVGE